MRNKIASIVLVSVVIGIVLFIVVDSAVVHVDATIAGVPEVEWERTFGCSEGLDSLLFVQQTSDGGYIFVGETVTYGKGFWLLKTDENGNEQWNKTLGGHGYMMLASVQRTSDGGYILVGSIALNWYEDDLNSNFDVLLTKVDEKGNKEWSRTIGGEGHQIAEFVQQTSDDGYIIVGIVEEEGTNRDASWLIKTDSKGNVQWEKTFGATKYYDSVATSVRQTTDGGYIITGYGYWYQDYTRNEDAWLIKTDENGNEQWLKTFGGKGEDLFLSIQRTSDGGYIIAGKTCSYGSGGDDLWLIKTNKNGNEQWNKTFGGEYDDCPNAVQQLSDGGYILVGHIESYGDDYVNDFGLVIKTDENGNEQWSKTFDCGDYGGDLYSIEQTSDGGWILAGEKSIDAWIIKLKSPCIETQPEITAPDVEKLPKKSIPGQETFTAPEEEWNVSFFRTPRPYDNDQAISVQQTLDGGYVIVGFTERCDDNHDVWLIKTDSVGNKEWDKTFGEHEKDDMGVSILQTSDGGYIFTGTTKSYGAVSSDAWLIKTDLEGYELWNKTFGGIKEDYGGYILQTSDGGYILTGTTESYGAGSSDVWLIKTNSNGNVQWDKTFGGDKFDGGGSIQLASDGGYIILGTTESYGAGSSDVWLIKTDSKGNVQWDKTFGGDKFDSGGYIQLASDGGYILTGTTESYGAGDYDIWLIKVDAGGRKQWDKTFGGNKNDWGSSIQQTSDGGYIIAGVTGSYGAGICDAWLIKTDFEGNKQWDKTFGGDTLDVCYSAIQTTDGGYAIAGSFDACYGPWVGINYNISLIKLEGPPQKAMKAELLSPSTDFSVLKDSNVPLKAYVTYEGEPTTGAILTASFSNGDPDVTLTEGENGIYTGTWTPTTIIEGPVESPVEITVEASHGTLGRVYAKVDGVIKTEIPLNIDILSPETGFTVNKSIPQLIRMKITDGSSNAVPGSTITKSEASFSNGDSTIRLYDDGAHHDGSADDGIYANVWIPENIDSGNNIEVGIEVKVYSGDIILASKAVDGVLTPNEYVLLDTVVAYEDDIFKSSVISVYYNVSKEDPEQYNLFLEINRKNEDYLEYLDYTINTFGELAISISEDVDIINNLRRTYALNWSEYEKKVPQKDAWPDGTKVPQYFSYADYYVDATIGIKTPEDTEKATSDVLSIINTITSFVPGAGKGIEVITYVFGIVLGAGGYILENVEDTVFDADLIIGKDSMYKEFPQHNIRDTIIQSWLDNDKEYESVVTITPLKFQNSGKNEIIMQLFADLDGKDILYNKKISVNILGIEDEHDQPHEQIWGDVVLENGFEVLDNEIMYTSAMGDDPQLCTAISVSRKVSKDDPNKQVLYFEISRKTDPENDHSYYINLRNVIFQISFDEDTDIIYSKIKDYEIGERNFNKLFYKDEYEIWPDGDQLTDDIESYIPQYFEYTDAMIYPETYEGRHHNFYQEIPSVSDSKEKMAKSKLLLTLVPYCWPITLMCAFDTFVEMVWQEKYGVDFVDNQKPYEEFLNTNERDLVVRGFLHERPEDDYESIVSEIPIILNNKPTDVYFTILFSVIGKDTKTAAYSKKITLKNVISPGEQLENTITNTIGMEFVPIPAGEFEMGSPLDEEDRYDREGPVHHVTIEKPFYMGRYEVTQQQWREIMGDNPSYFEGDYLPVEQVSWDDVQEFIKKLNEKEGTDKYRLPSEAEWEYACRAGTTTCYSFGDDESKLGDYAWYYSSKTHPVGQKKPNSWGLYDMHGNVWEWVQDCWHDSYNGAPTDGSAWILACDGAYRVFRGGSWYDCARDCRSALRLRNDPRYRGGGLGFRILQEV